MLVTAISATYAVPTRPTPGSIKEADILNLRYMGPNESQSPEWITLGPRESALSPAWGLATWRVFWEFGYAFTVRPIHWVHSSHE